MTQASTGHHAGMMHKPSPLRMLWITGALGACFVGIQWGLRDAPLLWFAQTVTGRPGSGSKPEAVGHGGPVEQSPSDHRQRAPYDDDSQQSERSSQPR